MQIVRERLKEARTAKGFSQKQMAEFLGISQPAYSQIESGKYPDMRISTLIEICGLLDVSTDWILGVMNGDPFAEIERFYMSVVDAIVGAYEDGAISYEAEDELISKVEAAKTQLDNVI